MGNEQMSTEELGLPPSVQAALGAQHPVAVEKLQLLAGELERSHPGAAAARPGGDAHPHPPWDPPEAQAHLGEHQPDRAAAGMLEAEQRFRRIIGHADLAKPAIAVERDIARHRQADTHNPTEDAVTLVG
jgi:hypothetical protein